MKILLTGLPKTEKTTLLKKLMKEADTVFWVAASEPNHEEGSRHGFFAENSRGNIAVIADKLVIDSECQDFFTGKSLARLELTTGLRQQIVVVSSLERGRPRGLVPSTSQRKSAKHAVSLGLQRTTSARQQQSLFRGHKSKIRYFATR